MDIKYISSLIQMQLDALWLLASYLGLGCNQIQVSKWLHSFVTWIDDIDMNFIHFNCYSQQLGDISSSAIIPVEYQCMQKMLGNPTVFCCASFSP